ncbi:MAG: cobalamin biosynthesis protein, partial [Actinomycetota bacterium]|nr:cobalamin biosynthesis protein [Actinomycetota bacterium]
MRNVISVSVTERGRVLAARLPYPAIHGEARATVAERWYDVDGLVLFLATGAAVRIIAPLLGDKATDPAVVCVDEAGRFAVALTGGHAQGANRLAAHVADLLGAVTVVTTATDAVGVSALDQLPAMVAAGDVAGVTTGILDGHPPTVVNHMDWPLPPGLATGPTRSGHDSGDQDRSERDRFAGGPRSSASIVVTDLVLADAPGLVALHPPSLVVGVGASTGAPVEEVRNLVDSALVEAGLARASVAEVATIDRRATDGAVLGLGLPVRAFNAAALNAVAVPSPSAVVEAAVG